MARVPPATRQLVPEHLQSAFDTVLRERKRLAGVAPRTGNYALMLHTPEACRRACHFADYLRQESALTERIVQLAILVIAREQDGQFIWNAHAAVARQAGLGADLIEALRDRKPLPAVGADEAAVIKYGQEYFRARRVSKGTFQEAQEQFGTRGLVELTMLMGYYAMLAFTLHAFDVDLPDDRTEPMLPV